MDREEQAGGQEQELEASVSEQMTAGKAIAVIALFLTLVIVARCGPDAYQIYVALKPENMCGVALGAESLSPSQKLRAVIYQFDCGATTPFTTQVSILNPGEVLPYSSGNVFGAYRGSREGVWRGSYAEIQWLSESTLQVSYIADAIVTKRSDK
ncbi:MAG: hypothetical protein ACT4PZ_13330 [Panacagrimonas sp.]